MTDQINHRPSGGSGRGCRFIWVLPLVTALLLSSCTHATVKTSQPTVTVPTKSSGPSTAAIKPPAVHLQVFNGSGYQCASKYTAQKLLTLGYLVDKSGNSDPISATVIMFPAALVHQATALQKLVPGSKLEPDNSVKEIMLIIGQNGATVTGVDLTTIPASCGLSH